MHDEEYDLFICTSVTYPEQQAWVVLAGNFSRVGYVHWKLVKTYLVQFIELRVLQA